MKSGKLLLGQLVAMNKEFWLKWKGNVKIRQGFEKLVKKVKI